MKLTDVGGTMDDMDDDDEGDDEMNGSETTGRWTKQEHALFLEALAKYGKEWKSVATMVKTRTVVQTRTHAQKYFQKLSKIKGGSGSIYSGSHSGDEGDGESIKRSSIKEDGSGGKVKSKRGRKSKSAQQGISTDKMLSTSISTDDMEVDQKQISQQLFYNTSPTMASIYQQGQGASIGTTSGLTISHLPPTIPFSASREHFPVPSPAACGKRKHAELDAARMLASSSMDSLEGIQVLSAMKDSGGHHHNRDRGFSRQDTTSSGNSGNSSLYLSIPTTAQHGGEENECSKTPGTPWEKGVKVLEEKVRAKRLSIGGT